MGTTVNQRTSRAILAVIEPLSARLLLSVQLDGSVLRIDGTEANDNIVVTVDKRFINVLVAAANDDVGYYSLTSVNEIDIRGFGGDDRISIDSVLDPLAYRTSVDGGAGNDRISTGAGADTIYGGDGNDKIYSNAGDNYIDAGAGRDSVFGSSGHETIYGGAGNDRIIDGDGNDTINAGKGNDYVEAGGGNDLICNPGGSDTVFAGAGSDTGKFAGGGIVYGEGDGDTFVSTGGALLYGGGGNDNLQAASVWGDAGADTLSGLLGPDEIHGGDGDDLIRGFSGEDTLLGDGGKDAIYGGADNDTLYGGEGDDNLYGTDGAFDKHRELAGRDVAYGGAGQDWFETGYKWAATDRTDADDRDLGTQNNLTQDSSYGWYNSGGVTYSSSGSTVHFSYGGDGGVNLNPVVTNALGKIGWISNGSFDGTNYVPPTLTRSQRLATRSGIVELPSTWQLGAITPAGDDVLWYRITAGTADTAGGKWRFVAVRRGTVLISDTGRPVSAPQPYGLDTAMLPISTQAEIRLAGADTIYLTAATFDSVPTGGPKTIHGILLDHGVIWLPTDGTEPYVSSGK